MKEVPMGVLRDFVNTIFGFNTRSNGNGAKEYRQDRYRETERGSGNHDHTWSKTSERGHSEGNAGENFPRRKR